MSNVRDLVLNPFVCSVGSTLFEPIESFSGECEKNLIGSEEVLPPEHTKGQDKIGQDSKLVRPIVRSRGPTPNVILSPRFNAEDDVEEIASEFDGICSRSDQRRLKLACLARDDARCVVTGFYDDVQVMSLSMADRARLPIAETHVAHILPYSLGSSVVSSLQLIFHRSLTDDMPVKPIRSNMGCSLPLLPKNSSNSDIYSLEYQRYV